MLSDISDLHGALAMIDALGELLGRTAAATALGDDIRNSFSQLNPTTSMSVLYFIWRKPYMLAGADTFIDNMLQRAGFVNQSPAARYPEIDVQEIADISPDLIFLSSEPYPFRQKHIDELQAISPRSKIMLVDGELFSWYGSRLRHSAGYLMSLIDNCC